MNSRITFSLTIVLGVLTAWFPFQSGAQLFVQWQATLGGTNYEECTFLQATADGGCVVAGGSSSGPSGNKSATRFGSSDFWMAKLDANGALEWDQTYGGTSLEYPNGLQVAPDGGYVLGGYSSSGANGNKTNVVVGGGGRDYWIVKTDASGTKQWDMEYGGSLNDSAWHLASAADGYLLSGASFSDVSGNKTTAKIGGDDWWAVKVDTNGIKQWDMTYGGTNNDYVYWAEPTADGGFLLAGESESDISGNKTNANIGLYDGWVIKVDSGGNKQWERVLGGTDQDYLSFALPTADDGYLLCGASRSGVSGNKTSPNYGSNDWWLVKLDADGVQEWDRSYGGSGHDFLKAIRPYQGGYLLFGTSWSGADGNKTVANFGESDYWLVKVDALGTIEWQQAFGGTNEDYAVEAFAQTSDGGFIVGGYSVSGANGNKTVPTYGNFDFWILKLVSAPTLAIGPAGAGQVNVSWMPAIPGFVLQETPSLSPAAWANAPSGSTNPVTIPAVDPEMLYRLNKP